jgi:hypothetical protein
MKRRIQILTGALALVLLLTGLAPAISRAQATPVASSCPASASCFVFTPAIAAGPAAVDLYLDSQLVAANVTLSNSSALITTTPGTHWLQLPETGSAPSAAKITASLTFAAGVVFDLVLRQASAGPQLNAYPIDVTAPAAGLSRSRIVNVWPGVGTIDVELGDPGDKTGLAANASFRDIRESGVSKYAESGLFSNLAAISVFAAGTANLKAAPALRPCPENSICSYVLIGPVGKSKTIEYALAVFPG